MGSFFLSFFLSLSLYPHLLSTSIFDTHYQILAPVSPTSLCYHPLTLYHLQTSTIPPSIHSLFFHPIVSPHITNPFFHFFHNPIHKHIKQPWRYHTSLPQSNPNVKPFTFLSTHSNTTLASLIYTLYCCQQLSIYSIHTQHSPHRIPINPIIRFF